MNDLIIPKSIFLIDALRSAYVTFSDKKSAKNFFRILLGYIKIQEKSYQMEFTCVGDEEEDKKDEANVTKIDNVEYFTDWECEKCSTINFSRVLSCVKCHFKKSDNCKTVLSIKKQFNAKGFEQNQPSHCLIIRSPSIPLSSEIEIFTIFSRYGKVKDVRMIKDKSGVYKEFAFVEYPTIDEAANVIAEFSMAPTQLRGYDISVDFSKLRNNDEKFKTVDKPLDFASNYNEYKSNFINNDFSINSCKDFLSLEQLQKLKDYEAKKLKQEIKEIRNDDDQVNFIQKEIIPISKEPTSLVVTENIEGKNLEKEVKQVLISDMTEFICTICQRKFGTKEKLEKHEKLSDLHKENIRKLQITNN